MPGLIVFWSRDSGTCYRMAEHQLVFLWSCAAMYCYRMSMLGNHVMSSKVYVRFWKYCSRPGFNDNVFTAWQAAVCTFSKLRNDQHDKVDGQLNSFVISTMYEFNKCVIHTIKIYHLVMYIISIFSIAVYEVGLKISNTRKKWSQDFHKVQIMIVWFVNFEFQNPKSFTLCVSQYLNGEVLYWSLLIPRFEYANLNSLVKLCWKSYKVFKFRIRSFRGTIVNFVVSNILAPRDALQSYVGYFGDFLP